MNRRSVFLSDLAFALLALLTVLAWILADVQ